LSGGADGNEPSATEEHVYFMQPSDTRISVANTLRRHDDRIKTLRALNYDTFAISCVLKGYGNLNRKEK